MRLGGHPTGTNSSIPPVPRFPSPRHLFLSRPEPPSAEWVSPLGPGLPASQLSPLTSLLSAHDVLLSLWSLCTEGKHPPEATASEPAPSGWEGVPVSAPVPVSIHTRHSHFPTDSGSCLKNGQFGAFVGKMGDRTLRPHDTAEQCQEWGGGSASRCSLSRLSQAGGRRSTCHMWPREWLSCGTSPSFSKISKQNQPDAKHKKYECNNPFIQQTFPESHCVSGGVLELGHGGSNLTIHYSISWSGQSGRLPGGSSV